MKHFLILICLPVISFASFSQNSMHWLSQKMRAADTVLLISHQATAGILIKHSNGKISELPALIINNKLNDSIVKESKIIRGKQLDTLIQILTQPLQSKKIEMANCFIPHHAILIIKNGTISYVDICFRCRRFTKSKDLENLEHFDTHKWSELKSFFLQLDFKYELTPNK